MDYSTFAKYVFGYILPYIVIALGVFLSFTTDIIKDRSFEPFPKKPYSFSRAQLMWWSVIIISIFCSYYGFHRDFIKLKDHESLLILLGISISTTGVATFIDYMDIMKDLDRHQDYQSNGFFTDILSDKVIENPNPTQSNPESKIASLSVHRFQALCFNIIFGLIFIFHYIFNNDIIDFTTIPLALMGISSGGYLLLKQGENTQAGDDTAKLSESNKVDEAIKINRDNLMKTGAVYIDKKIDTSIPSHPTSMVVYYTDNKALDEIKKLNITDVPIIYENIKVIKAQCAVLNNNKKSTIGGFLQDKWGHTFGLGTCHGLKINMNDIQNVYPYEKIIQDSNNNDIGKLEIINMEDDCDLGLVRMNQNFTGSSNANVGTQSIYPPVVDSDAGLQVELISDVRGQIKMTGVLRSVKNTVKFDELSAGQVFSKPINYVIAINDLSNTNPITVDGDSGVWVTTTKNNQKYIIGMVIGADPTYTYLISMDKIIQKLKNLSYDLHII